MHIDRFLAVRTSCLTCGATLLLAVVGIMTPILCSAKTTRTTYRYTGDIHFDIAKIPFSRFGSYMAFSELSGSQESSSLSKLYLRNMRGGPSDAEHPAFKIELLREKKPISFSILASPTLLHLTAEGGGVDIFFSKTNRIRFRANGVSVSFVSVGPEHSEARENGHWELESNSGISEKYMLSALNGGLSISPATPDAPMAANFTPSSGSNGIEGMIETYDDKTVPSPVHGGFTSEQNAVKQEYRKWLNRMPQVSPEFGAGAELAAYVNWESVVAPKGFLDRPAMLMSKNWMARVWAWDHCFNAMALSFRDPNFAWQQFIILFDNQLPSGALPDTIRDATQETKYSKPPIHGWALNWMMQHGGYSDRKHLAEVYVPLERWTNWRLQDGDGNHDGLPKYNTGPDSGWDNSTVFQSGVSMETPELSAYLVLQMDTLSKIAHDLGKDSEAAAWAKRSDQLLQTMLTKLWRADHFVAIRADNGAAVESESLELYLPLVLGKKLPIPVREKMIEGLMRQGRFRTDHGFSSEALTSKYYGADSYWCGPIWAPTSMLLAEGMDSIGQKTLAENLRLDFCKMAQQNGVSENFDAQTGNGLRDPAYTWTSSVYLIFAHQLWASR
ncbi:glycoside hydrolase family 37 [Capsulimonas corticalis]|uniref:Glycoside hydrolase family 37 n=1 Tax=Capsulimonas corticalis TaxID=2219043 RepID=A0A402CP18_9BACT|nr:trehalase family glycosidase [Capsulimonas corticalis]BDI33161.1 glycoside hydrolase family 37 [Capsulimonas corticalis]